MTVGALKVQTAPGVWTVVGGTTGSASGSSGSGDVTDGDKGDVVVSASGTTWLLDPTVVTPAARTVLAASTSATMRSTLGAAALSTTINTTLPLTGGGDLSGSRTLNVNAFTPTASGVVPASTGGTAKYLRADGQWVTPPTGSGGGGISQQPTPPTDTTILWADTSQVGIEENARYLSNVTGATYTLVLADRGKLLLCSNATAQTVTVPTNTTAAFVIGTQIDLVQMGSGALSLGASGGVTINATPSLGLRAQYAAASLIKTATNTWLLIGDLS